MNTKCPKCNSKIGPYGCTFLDCVSQAVAKLDDVLTEYEKLVQSNSKLREENERLNGLARYQCEQHPDLPKSYVCALCMQSDCFALRDNKRMELEALLREARNFITNRTACSSPDNCWECRFRKKVDAALEGK